MGLSSSSTCFRLGCWLVKSCVSAWKTPSLGCRPQHRILITSTCVMFKELSKFVSSIRIFSVRWFPSNAMHFKAGLQILISDSPFNKNDSSRVHFLPTFYKSNIMTLALITFAVKFWISSILCCTTAGSSGSGANWSQFIFLPNTMADWPCK